MRSWFKRRAGETGLPVGGRPAQARDISVGFLGEIGKDRSVEDYIREIEAHRWELEHRINQIADHLSVGRKAPSSEPGASPPSHDPTALVDVERDRRCNIEQAKEHPDAVAASDRALDAFRAKLPVEQDQDDIRLVPQIFHFVYGFRDRGDLPYFGYMAIKSALHFNPGWRVYLHCIHAPEGPNWDLIKSRVEVIRLDDFTYFRNARFHHYAHKADIVRLLAINLVGGVYLDIDTITQKPFDDLRRFPFTMGVQAGGSVAASGLCNAVMIGQPGAVFSTRWLDSYDTFRSKGRDNLWDYHSVKLPGIMMAQAPETIHVLEYRAFFYPLWESIEAQLFTDRGAERFAGHFDDAYCFHLWHGGTSHFLETVDDRFVRTSRSIYASIARQVEGLTP